MNTDRLDWIDAIRGIAAILVVFHHLIWQGIINPAILLGLFDFGKIGVVLFFFVSGFVIPFSLFKYPVKAIQTFCLSRFFRLYPMYWLSIILYMLCIDSNIDNIRLFFNITMFQKFFGFDDIIGVFWTLQIELVFYFLCVFLFWKKLLQNTTTLFRAVYINIAIAFWLSVLRWFLQIKFPVALPLALIVMFIGAIWKKYLDSEVSKKKVYQVLLVFIISLLPVCVLAYSVDFTGERWYTYFITYTVALTLFISLTTFAKIKVPTFYLLGRISYSVYLLHFIVISWLLKFSLGSIEVIVITIFLTIIISYATYEMIEKTSINIGKHLTRLIATTRKQPLVNEVGKLMDE